MCVCVFEHSAIAYRSGQSSVLYPTFRQYRDYTISSSYVTHTHTRTHMLICGHLVKFMQINSDMLSISDNNQKIFHVNNVKKMLRINFKVIVT